MTQKIDQLLSLISAEIDQTSYGHEPAALYDPIKYIMRLGGKRLRPLLTTLAYSLYKDDVKNILRQAIAVEAFHNFTLMHDDIMDQAPLRRGQETVHEKWNHNTAILSGDVMLVKAYEMLLTHDNELTVQILKSFSKCAAEVCEGQQKDMLFENCEEVSESQYLNMINLKTAVLLGFSLELGGMLAYADPSDCNALKEFGINIGLGFQLQDDLLDVYADKTKFGKQVGGDILSNKKTFLLIMALQNADNRQKKVLDDWLSKKQYDPEEKVKAVTAIYNEMGIKALTEKKMNKFFELAFLSLRKVNASLQRKSVLREFAKSLLNRET